MTDRSAAVGVLATLAFALLAAATAVTAETVTVDSAAALESAVRTATAGTRIVLTGDLDLGSLRAPLGADGGACTPFNGTLDGAGHVLHSLNASGPAAGLFCALAGATVANVTLAASCRAVGTERAGAGAAAVLAGTAVTLRNVTSHAALVRADATVGAAAGGLVGAVTGATSITLADCVQTGRVEAEGTGARSGRPRRRGHGRRDRHARAVHERGRRGHRGRLGHCCGPRDRRQRDGRRGARRALHEQRACHGEELERRLG